MAKKFTAVYWQSGDGTIFSTEQQAEWHDKYGAAEDVLRLSVRKMVETLERNGVPTPLDLQPNDLTRVLHVVDDELTRSRGQLAAERTKNTLLKQAADAADIRVERESQRGNLRVQDFIGAVRQALRIPRPANGVEDTTTIFQYLRAVEPNSPFNCKLAKLLGFKTADTVTQDGILARLEELTTIHEKLTAEVARHLHASASLDSAINYEVGSILHLIVPVHPPTTPRAAQTVVNLRVAVVQLLKQLKAAERKVAKYEKAAAKKKSSKK